MVRQAKAQRMLTHDQIWGALDRLAARAGMSPSGLAKRAGLDPTTFNRSKRVTSEGRARWPSTESIAKALAATDASMETFARLVDDGDARDSRMVPLLGFARAGASGAFDDAGSPAGKDWTSIRLPAADDSRSFGLKLSGEAFMPVYRDGDIILVSLETRILGGDRVLLKTTSGELVVATMKRRSATCLELLPLGATHSERRLAAGEVAWVAKIIWASQ